MAGRQPEFEPLQQVASERAGLHLGVVEAEAHMSAAPERHEGVAMPSAFAASVNRIGSNRSGSGHSVRHVMGVDR